MKASAFDYACPTTLGRGAGPACRRRSRFENHRRRPELDAGARLSPCRSRASDRSAAKCPASTRSTSARDGVTFGARRPLVRHRGRCAARRRAAARQGGDGACRALPDPSAWYGRRQPRPCRQCAPKCPRLAVACDATITVQNQTGRRTIAAADFFVGPLTTVLDAHDLLTAVHFPAWPAKRRWGFEEFSRRRGDFALYPASPPSTT